MLKEQLAHFDRLFTVSDDPWQYRTAWTEQRRFALMLAILDRASYGRVFEAACATGAFTALLADRCETLVACDGSSIAVGAARRATSAFANVTIEQWDIPDEWPHGGFDLVVLVDFLYYLTPVEIVDTVEAACASLPVHGSLLVGHWQRSAHDFRTSPQEVHVLVQSTVGRPPDRAYSEGDLVLELWDRS